jgi:NAD(P)-dependent dehydrogenase (short-subunit alcohol dehydrogenase family)
MRLEGKKALVTGAARGIGRAIALAFAKEGADVAITARDMELLRPLAVEIKALGRKAHCMVWDVTDTHSIEARLTEARDALGGLDILVNNAGVVGLPKNHPDQTPEAAYDYVMDINLKALYLVCQAVVPMLKAQKGGVIINLGSDAGHRGAPNPYCISKWGVAGFTKGLSQSVAKDGIRVNAVSPGPVATRMMCCPDGKPAECASLPQGRYSYPEEVASVVVFLASDDAKAVHAQSIVLNTANS